MAPKKGPQKQRTPDTAARPAKGWYFDPRAGGAKQQLVLQGVATVIRMRMLFQAGCHDDAFFDTWYVICDQSRLKHIAVLLQPTLQEIVP